MGQARWTGARLDTVLDRVGAHPKATHLVFHSVDPSPPNATAARTLPIVDLRNRGAILAWAMNGDPLSHDHGFPLRLVVPGWVGHHWIKWLTRIDWRHRTP